VERTKTDLTEQANCLTPGRVFNSLIRWGVERSVPRFQASHPQPYT